MTLPIRKGSTHKITLGPAVAVGDGFTPVTNLDVSTADEAEVILHDNGTVVDISGYTWAAIATADGYYHLTLQTGISNTVGHMTVVINDDNLCLPITKDFVVMDTASYDALYASTATILTSGDVGMLYKSTIATLTAATQWDMTDAFATDDVGINNIITIVDQGNSANFHTTFITDLDQANNRIIVDSDAPWTAATGDTVRVMAQEHTRPHSAAAIVAALLATKDNVLAYAQLLARSDAAVFSDRSTELGEINANEGSGAGDYSSQTDSLEALEAVNATIKVQTDKMVFTVTNQLDVNVLSFVGTLYKGDGTVADKLRSTLVA